MGVSNYTLQKSERDDWITIKILTKQYQGIGKKIKNNTKYLSVPEFVRVAIDEKLERDNHV